MARPRGALQAVLFGAALAAGAAWEKQVSGTPAVCAGSSEGWFRLRYVGSATSNERCLSLFEEPPQIKRCEDAPGWTDGTNGCAMYALAEEDGSQWCSLYGMVDAGMGGAATQCCACGGGNGTYDSFDVGSVVEVRRRLGWFQATVRRVRPQPDVAYEVAAGRRVVQVRVEANVRSQSTKRVSDPVVDGVELRSCNGSDKRQLWRIESKSLISAAEDAALYGEGTRRETLSRSRWAEVELAHAMNETADAWRRIFHLRCAQRCLSGGRFSSPDYAKPMWVNCAEPLYQHLPVLMWECEPTSSAESDYDSPVQRLKRLVSDGLTHAIAPWEILGVERGASAKQVKAAFRSLSLLLHPDKRDLYFSDEDAAHIDTLFEIARSAYEALKSDNEAEREAFRIKHESLNQRFFVGSLVRELDRSHFDLNDNLLRLSVSGRGGIWVIFMYSPSCSMSRAVAPLVKLAARAAPEQSFGAVACGFHERQRVGFGSTFSDPVCRAIEPDFSETPRIVAIVEDPEGSTKAAQWRLSYESVRAESLPRRLIDFGRRAHSLWVASSLVRDLASFDEISRSANSTRLVLLLDNSTLCSSIRAHAPTVAPELKQVKAELFAADCNTLDCPHVAPNLLVYAPNSTLPRRLLPEPFGDLRDAQIALTALVAALSALVAGPNHPLALSTHGKEANAPDGGPACDSANAPFGKIPPSLDVDRIPSPPDSSFQHLPPEELPSTAGLKLAARISSRGRRAGGVIYGGNRAGGSSPFGGNLPR